jgi:hypothetical protein
MKIELKKINIAVLCSFILIALGCASDNEFTRQETKVSQAKNWFDQYDANGSNYALFQNMQYDWNQARVTRSEDGTETIIIPVTELKKDVGEIWEQKLYIYNLGNDSYEASLVEIYPDKRAQPDSHSIEGTNFTGIISIWDLKAGFVKSARFKDNHAVEEGIVEFLASSKSMTSKAPPILCTECEDTGAGGGTVNGGQLRDVIITPQPSQHSPVIIYIPSGSFSGGGGSTPTGYIPHGGGGGGGGGITAPTTVQIIDELTGKAKCLNGLLNKNGDSFVKKLLANFVGASEFNIKIVSKEKVTNLDKNGVPKEVNGKTIHLPGSTLMTIEISSSKADVNASLDVVRTILHEYIHADIFRKLNTKSNEIGNKSTDFKKTYEEYENHHGAIAGLYLKSMKDALKDFHKNVLTDDYNKYTNYFGEVPSDAFYEALAWGGLKDIDVKAWTDLPAEKKASIEALANRVPILSKTVPCSN